MISIPDVAKELLLRHDQQYIKITVPYIKENEDGTLETREIIFTEKDLVQGSFIWDRYVASGETLEIGSAIASEISFDLFNKGSFVNTQGETVPTREIAFVGAKIAVQVGIITSKQQHTAVWISLGKFIIDKKPKTTSIMRISALDQMVMFDRYVDWGVFSPTEYSPLSLISDICRFCGKIPYNLTTSKVVNSAAPINMGVVKDNLNDTDDYTYRDLLQYVCQILGCVAYMSTGNENNGIPKLTFKWFETPAETNPIELDTNVRYDSSTEEKITLTGLSWESNDVTYVAGDSDYEFSISKNILFDSIIDVQKQLVVNNVYNHCIKNVTYIPMECSVLPFVWVEPLDIIKYKDVDDGEIMGVSYITHTTFELNGAVKLASVGESAVSKSFAQSGQGSREAMVIKKAQKEINEMFNSRAEVILNMNEVLANALGLFMFTITESNGSESFYATSCDIKSVMSQHPTYNEIQAITQCFIDKYAIGEELSELDVVYKFNAEGFFWLKGWSDWVIKDTRVTNDKSSIYQNGITKDGNAILNQIYATGIEVSSLGSGFATKINPDSFTIYSNQNGADTLVLKLDGNLNGKSQLNKVKIMSNDDIEKADEDKAYIEIGHCRLMPSYSEDGKGMDIVYLEDIN